VIEFHQAFAGDLAALGYATEAADWWLSVLPLSNLARAWDRWSRRLQPQTMPILVTPCAVLRGGGA
jgi:hypothetical protein